MNRKGNFNSEYRYLIIITLVLLFVTLFILLYKAHYVKHEKWVISSIVEGTQNLKDMSEEETQSYINKEVTLDSKELQIGDMQWKIIDIEDDLYNKDNFYILYRTYPTFLGNDDVRIRMINCEGFFISIIETSDLREFIFIRLQFYELLRTK
ncbi:MAG: hypothetical protein BWY00_01507 [Firmicutes bacterium ADurb.Bin153]|nr:MAG: hypothetical protein BWY00_01507 [Firmicutes bacterium ADurb.Bin153]